MRRQDASSMPGGRGIRPRTRRCDAVPERDAPPGPWRGPRHGSWPRGPGERGAGWPRGGAHWPGGPGGSWSGWWPGPPGPFRAAPKAGRGDVRAAILALLREGPRNGYQIMSEIEDRSDGAWRPSPGAV